MNIRTRLTIYFTAIVMVIVIIGSVILYLSIHAYTEKVFYQRLHAKALTTANRLLYMQNVDSLLLAKIDRLQSDLLLDENITVYDSTDKNIYTNNDTIYYKESKDLFDRIRREGDITYEEGRNKIIGFTYNIQSHKNIIIAGAIDQNGDALLQKLKRNLVFVFFISMILVVLSGWFFIGRALEPISLIIHKVSTLSPVENSERLTTRFERDEIGALVKTFNTLFDKLEDSFRLQKYFMANISHELNNPLTKIKSQIEVSLMQNREKEDYRLILQSILEDVNELSILIQDMLKFSKVSQGNLIYDSFRIDELMFEIRDDILTNYPGYQIDIIFTDPPHNEDILVRRANKPLLTTALKNIIENACKYAPDHIAYLDLLVKGDMISLTIKDNGPGIPPEDLPNIFELFYRSPAMMSVKGYGIGLALAQKIIVAHGFDVTVRSEMGIGTTFTVLFSA